MSERETETIDRPGRPVTNGSETPDLLEAVRPANAQRYGEGARARLAVTLCARKLRAWVLSKWRRVRREVAKPAEKHGGTFLWSDPSESLAEHWAYIKAGGWSDVPLLQILGRAYGLVVFLPCAAGLAGVWIARRPTRLLISTVVVLICWRSL